MLETLICAAASKHPVWVQHTVKTLSVEGVPHLVI